MKLVRAFLIALIVFHSFCAVMENIAADGREVTAEEMRGWLTHGNAPTLRFLPGTGLRRLLGTDYRRYRTTGEGWWRTRFILSTEENRELQSKLVDRFVGSTSSCGLGVYFWQLLIIDICALGVLQMVIYYRRGDGFPAPLIREF